MDNNVIIISGPTGVGKTELSIALAKKLNTEIISADSMQIYKNMDIGTAKITESEKENIYHHMLDIIEPNQSFSVQEFQKLAYSIMEQMFKENLIPIIVGGTGLYIDSLIYDYDFVNVKPDYELRNKLEEIYKENPETLLNKVKTINPIYENLNLKDMKKLIRAIEVYEKENKLINYNRNPYSGEINYKLFVLYDDREKLYQRINDRVDLMLEKGLISEVKKLLESGVGKNSQSMKAIGYKEVIEYLDDNITYQEMVNNLKQNSRRYAKRQLTWFRRNEFSNWIDIGKYTKEEIIDIIIKSLKE